MSLTSGANCCKLEKADILELAVEHLRGLQQQQQQQQQQRAEAIAADYRTSPARGDATALDDDAATEEACARYEAGFADCVAEVQRFMTSVQQGHHGDVIEHLSTCLRTTGRRRSAVYRLTAIESGSVSGRLSETDQTMATWGHGDWPTTLLAADEMRATSCGEDTNHSNASRSTKPPMSDAGRTDAPAASVNGVHAFPSCSELDATSAGWVTSPTPPVHSYATLFSSSTPEVEDRLSTITDRCRPPPRKIAKRYHSSMTIGSQRQHELSPGDHHSSDSLKQELMWRPW